MVGGAVLVFSSGMRIGALPLQFVRETMRPLPITAVESPSPFVAGLAVVRGETVPVVNVERVLSAQSSAGSFREPGRFITVRVADRSVALAVETVLGVWPSSAIDMASLPPLFEGSEAVAAIGRLDGRLVTVLRAAALIPPEVWAGMRTEGDADDGAAR